MKKHIFTKSISLLIVGTLAAAAIFRNQWIVIAVFAMWLLFLTVQLVLVNRRRITHWFKSLIPVQEQISKEPPSPPQSAVMEVPDVSDSPGVVLLRHLNCRISDKLKSAYPDITWNWEAQQPEQIATKGGTGRIKLHQAGEFTHAEVTVDQFARIEFKMMKLVDINTLIAGTAPTGIPEAEPVTTDASAWFDLVGREQLTAIVTELNTRNYRKLSIAENGDVYVVEDGASVKQGSLENLPGKNFWKELSELITSSGPTTQVSGDQLHLTW